MGNKASKPTLRLANFLDKGLMWVLVICVLLLLAYAYYRPISIDKYEKKEFSGKIINKITTSSEYYTGSSFTRHLEIEEKTGEHRKIRVSEEIYRRAEVGMWIEVSERGMRLYGRENEISHIKMKEGAMAGG
jgi:hypothetical protein